MTGEGFGGNRLISEVVTVATPHHGQTWFRHRLTEAHNELHGTTFRRRLGQGRFSPLPPRVSGELRQNSLRSSVVGTGTLCQSYS